MIDQMLAVEVKKSCTNCGKPRPAEGGKYKRCRSRDGKIIPRFICAACVETRTANGHKT